MHLGYLLAPIHQELRRAWRERDKARRERECAGTKLRALRALLAHQDDIIDEQQRLLRRQDQLLRQQHRRIAQQENRIAKLEADLEEAQRAAKRQAAPFRRRKRKLDPKRPGRKPGHPAALRPEPEHIDEEIEVPLRCCPHCQGAVEDVRPMEPQVVVDLPAEIKLLVRRYHNQSGYCAQCDKRVRSRHADQFSTANGAAGVQLGPRALTLAVELKYRLGLVFNKVREVFGLFFKMHIASGTIARAAKRLAARCEPTYRSLIQTVRTAAVTHADETGWHIVWAQRRAWLWVFATVRPQVTVYAIRQSRGSRVLHEILGMQYEGVLCTDGWSAYGVIDCAKAQCAAHILRRAAELLEVHEGDAGQFPLAIQRLLLAAIILKAMKDELCPSDYAACVEQVRGEMDELLDGDIEEPANHKFARHLRRHRDELLLFLDIPELDATNNLAERELRPAVVARKLSAGNRTEAGARTQEVLASICRTARRNNIVLVDVLPRLFISTNPSEVLPLTSAATKVVITKEADRERPRTGSDGRVGGLPVVRRVVRRDCRADGRVAGPRARAPPRRPHR